MEGREKGMEDIRKVFGSLTQDAKKIFNLIHKNGPRAKNELLLLTNMKLSTLNRVMEPLEKRGLIIQSSTGQSTGGRKPALYDVNASQGYLAGVDISRTYTQVIITDLKMEILYKQQFTMDASYTPEKTLEMVRGIIQNGLQQIKAPGSQMLGVGVGTVGPMDREKGIINNPVNFAAPGWHDVHVKDMLQDKIQCPVFIDNGANTAVLAEMLFGQGRNHSNLVYIHCGVGIRTGTISSRTIIRTVNDAEDAFGHMVIDVDGEPCACGNYGCIECYSSIGAISRKFIAELKKGRASKVSKSIDEISYIDICQAAEEGDELAREIITGSAVVLGTGLANFINLLNPGLVILSGPLIKRSKLFYQKCTEVADRKCYKSIKEGVLFSQGGNFGDHTIAIGSAAMVFEHCINNKSVYDTDSRDSRLSFGASGKL
jgi:predicted NBD/HSP70 family sugar kinase/DNA-binding MarR family transcriptional regulator